MSKYKWKRDPMSPGGFILDAPIGDVVVFAIDESVEADGGWCVAQDWVRSSLVERTRREAIDKFLYKFWWLVGDRDANPGLCASDLLENTTEQQRDKAWAKARRMGYRCRRVALVALGEKV